MLLNLYKLITRIKGKTVCKNLCFVEKHAFMLMYVFINGLRK